MTVEAAAAAAFTIANARMTDLIRKVTVERGFDPRDFALYAYGGLGPLHAPFFGMDLDVDAIVVPLGQISSVFSAYGIAVSDLLHVYETSRVLVAPFDAAELERTFSGIEAKAKRQLSVDGVPESEQRIHRFLEMRYQGQFSENRGPGRGGAAPGLRSGRNRHRLRRALSLHFRRRFPVERRQDRSRSLSRRGDRSKEHSASRARPATPPGERSPEPEREMYWPSEGRFLPTPVLHGDSLPAARVISGPAAVDSAQRAPWCPPDGSAPASRRARSSCRRVTSPACNGKKSRRCPGSLAPNASTLPRTSPVALAPPPAGSPCTAWIPICRSTWLPSRWSVIGCGRSVTRWARRCARSRARR